MYADECNRGFHKNRYQPTGENIMGREQKTNKEAKKKAALTPKEKKAAKKIKKEENK